MEWDFGSVHGRRKMCSQVPAPRRRRCAWLVAVLMAAAVPDAQALSFTYNGFANAIFGDVLSGDSQPYLNFNCPCYVGNYEYGSMYEHEASWRGIQGNRESLLGLQGTLQFWKPLSATAQVVARASTEKATVDWAYLTYHPDPHWSFQAGRKRLPLYYYSDSVYIGYSYPWVRAPTDVYGWDIFDYDGANISYSHDLGDWNLVSNVYAGRRATGDNLMEGHIYYGEKVYESWSKIIGGSIDLTNDYVGLRLIAQHNKIDLYAYDSGADQPAVQYYSRSPQDILGLAFTADYKGFVWRSEANTFKRSQQDFTSFSYLAGGGYRWKDWVGMFTESWYYERMTTGDATPERQHTHTVTLRWDFYKSWAAKLQFDMFRYNGDFQFTGDARVVSASLNTVF
jgi:hypothetical protein